MTRGMTRSAITVFGICGGIALAHAATVTPEHGVAHLNAGSGFVAVEAPTLAPEAAQIMVAPAGSALITYSATCAVRVPSGVWRVQAQPPCEKNVTLIDFTRRMNQEAPPVEGDGPSTTTLVVGGVVVAGAVAGAIILSQDDDDKSSTHSKSDDDDETPASP